jgi:hypothetical protein
MAKRLFNEAEKFVIQTYADVRLLEETLDSVRSKYREEVKRIGAEVKERHPELDFFDEQFKASWATGYLVFSRSAWAGNKNFPSGLFVDNLRLELLTSPKEEPPNAWVWTRPSRRAGIDVTATRRALWQRLPKLLTSEELAKCRDDKDDDVPVVWPMATQQEVLDWLLNGQIDLLSERVMEQVDMFVKMLPVLDEHLTKGRSAKR